MAALCIDYGYKFTNSPTDLTRDQINFLITALADRMERIAVAKSGDSGTTRFIFSDDDDDEDREDIGGEENDQ